MNGGFFALLGNLVVTFSCSRYIQFVRSPSLNMQRVDQRPEIKIKIMIGLHNICRLGVGNSDRM